MNCKLIRTLVITQMTHSIKTNITFLVVLRNSSRKVLQGLSREFLLQFGSEC